MIYHCRKCRWTDFDPHWSLYAKFCEHCRAWSAICLPALLPREKRAQIDNVVKAVHLLAGRAAAALTANGLIWRYICDYGYEGTMLKWVDDGADMQEGSRSR